jgi:GNAT superfamily N-acetyltransferase
LTKVPMRLVSPLTYTHTVMHSVLIARVAGRTVGSARGEVSGRSCEICAVCVDPLYQGRGIGAAFVRAIEQAQPDVAQFELTTNTLVPGNVEFHERHGYQVVGRTRYRDRIVLAHLIKMVPPQDQPSQTPSLSHSVLRAHLPS